MQAAVYVWQKEFTTEDKQNSIMNAFLFGVQKSLKASWKNAFRSKFVLCML